ncbi:hypothetical protein ACWIG3_11585 [Streptomyces celluloflavus]
MGIPTRALAYFDEEPTFVHAARTLGIQAHLFTEPAEFTAHLRALGLPLTSRDRQEVPAPAFDARER